MAGLSALSDPPAWGFIEIPLEAAGSGFIAAFLSFA